MGIFSEKKIEEATKKQLTEGEKKYSDKIKIILNAPENKKLVEFVKYLYLNDTQEFINQTYPIRLMSLVLIMLGLSITVLFVIIFEPIIIIFGILAFVFGFLIYMLPFKVLQYLIKRNMTAQEKKLFTERYDILRQIYYNEKMYGDAFHLPSAKTKSGKIVDTFTDENGNVLVSPSQVKNPSTMFRFLVALKSNEKPAFYEKLLDITKLFNDYELISFFKTVSERLRGTNFKEYFESQQEENSASYTNIIKERATLKQSVNTMLLLGFAIVGLFLGIGAVLQHLLSQIFTHLLSGIAGGASASTSISSILSVFQIITALPPIALGYFILPVIVLIVIYKLKKDSQEMFS
jgi:hypothetical protein